LSSAELTQQSTTAPQLKGQFTLTVTTTSVPLLVELVHADSGTALIEPLTLTVRRSGAHGASAKTELADVFAKAVVTSLNESLSSGPQGVVTFALAGATSP
jgi:hypothetical protein